MHVQFKIYWEFYHSIIYIASVILEYLSLATFMYYTLMKRKQSLNSDGQQFYQYSINKTNNTPLNCMSGVMVGVIALSVVDHGFDGSNQRL